MGIKLDWNEEEIRAKDISTYEPKLGLQEATVTDAYIVKGKNIQGKTKYDLVTKFDIVDKETGEVVEQTVVSYFAGETGLPFNKGSNGQFPTDGLSIVKAFADIKDETAKDLILIDNPIIKEVFGEKKQVVPINIIGMNVLVGFGLNDFNGKANIEFVKSVDINDEDLEKLEKALERKIKKVQDKLDNKSSNQQNSNAKSQQLKKAIL